MSLAAGPTQTREAMPGPALLGRPVATTPLGVVAYALSHNAPSMIAPCVKWQRVTVGTAGPSIRGGTGPAPTASECAVLRARSGSEDIKGAVGDG